MKRPSLLWLLALAPLHSAQAQGSLVGFVRDSTGVPLANSQISIDAVNRVATADAMGRYAFNDLPIGLRLIRVRRVGYSPTSRMVKVVEGESRQDFVLDRLVVLDTVRASEMIVRTRLVTEINDRRRMGFGHFKDSTTLTSHGGLASVFEDIPSVMVKSRGPQAFLIYLPGTGLNGRCLANLWIDGKKIQLAGQPDHGELTYLHPDEIGVIEVYVRMSETPVQYITRGPDLSACGSVVIWTKRILPEAS